MIQFIKWGDKMFFKQKYKNLPKISVVIPAGGSSSRMDGINKQLLLLDDIPVIVHTLRIFDDLAHISEIILVCKEELIGDYMRLCEDYDIQKLKSIVTGGATRQGSVFAGIKACSSDTEYYLIHDGARPLVTEDIITRCIDDVLKYKATTASVRAKDTIKIADKDGFIDNTPDRTTMYLTQTPQVFERVLYDRAMQIALQNDTDYTDDCQLIEGIGQRVYLSEGDYTNIKITTPDDLWVAQAFLDARRYTL